VRLYIFVRLFQSTGVCFIGKRNFQQFIEQVSDFLYLNLAMEKEYPLIASFSDLLWILGRILVFVCPVTI